VSWVDENFCGILRRWVLESFYVASSVENLVEFC
jgi:hypothetical protein